MAEILIQCVVVLYECALENSTALRSLSSFFHQRSDLAQRVSLLIYDNSRYSHAADLINWNAGIVEYCHSPENGGLAMAYNKALQMALDKDVEWLLLLDQDTVVTDTLFPALFAAITSSLPPAVSAVVPKLVQNGKILSPQIVGHFHNHNFPTTLSGICPNEVTAFNSAACLRVSSLVTVGGFCSEYWLDYLDHITFHRLQAAGGKVLVLDLMLEHHLSLLNLETEMSLDRYSNLLASEWRFVHETGTIGSSFIHRLRLLKRALHHGFLYRNTAYALRTFRSLLE